MVARGCPPSCPPAWRACGRLAQEVGGPRLSPQLPSQLSSVWRACGRLAQKVGGPRLSSSCPPAVLPRGEPVVGWPRRSVARELSPQLSPERSLAWRAYMDCWPRRSVACEPPSAVLRAVPPAHSPVVPPHGELIIWLRRSVARDLSPQLSLKLSRESSTRERCQ